MSTDGTPPSRTRPPLTRAEARLAAQALVIANRKLGRPTEQWKIDLAAEGEPPPRRRRFGRLMPR